MGRLSGMLQHGINLGFDQGQAAYHGGILDDQPHGHPAPEGMTDQMYRFPHSRHHGSHQHRFGLVCTFFRDTGPGIRTAMAVVVHRDRAEAGREDFADTPPLRAGTAATMQQQPGFALAGLPVMNFDSFDRQFRHLPLLPPAAGGTGLADNSLPTFSKWSHQYRLDDS